MPQTDNLNGNIPPAPSNAVNVHWQADPPSANLSVIRNVSAYIVTFTGDTGNGGGIGAVPAPAAGDTTAGKFLSANGSWEIPSSGSSNIFGNANQVYATPDGSNGNAVLRSLTANDIPLLSESKINGLVGDLSNRALTSTTITTNSPLSGTGNLIGNITIAISNATATTVGVSKPDNSTIVINNGVISSTYSNANVSSLLPVYSGNVNASYYFGDGTNLSGVLHTVFGVDTEGNILLSTPTSGKVMYASDLGQFMIADGTTWYIDSSYMSSKNGNQDMGYIQGSNRIGYGQSYITDKDIINCAIGYGSGTPKEGMIRQDPVNHVLQIYQNGSWQTIVSNFRFEEIAADDYALEHMPIGFTQWIQVFSGNSDSLGLNGLPLIQGYKVSMGANPFPPNINCGSF